MALAASAGLLTGPPSRSGAVRPHDLIDVNGKEVYVKTPVFGLRSHSFACQLFQLNFCKIEVVVTTDRSGRFAG